MKLLLVVVTLVVAVSAKNPINNDYHNTIGVFEAARIKKAEESTDFDGSRIAGGRAASLGQFPYFGGLFIALTDGRQSVCGSSLISNTRLVTAAFYWRTPGATVHVGAAASESLNHMNLQVITNDVCRRTYASTVIASTICMATLSGRSVCRGDSGGSLTAGGQLVSTFNVNT